jgi:hypothetical protein
MTAAIFDGSQGWVGSEPFVRRVQYATGASDWLSANLGTPWFPSTYSAPAIGVNHVFHAFFGAPTTSGGLRILDRATGALLYGETGMFRSPIWTGDTLYVVGALDKDNHLLTARDAGGSVLWTASTTLGGGTGSPALGNGVLVVSGANGNIEAFDASNGSHLWSHAVGTALYQMVNGLRVAKGTSGTPAITDSLAWIGSLDGKLYALDLASGSEVWSWDFGVPVASSPAVSGNMLFVATEDGHLYAFNSTTPTTGTSTASPEYQGYATIFAAGRPHPNPSADVTRIEWTMPQAAHARVRVFDVAGRRVNTLVDRSLDAGEHEAMWDGRDQRGAAVAPGVYFVRIEAGGNSANRKLVRIHP